ncbi:protein real-time isoform X2 [Condylostylus longicornis]|uniref:protein real-time isoform X2 n=1 Tax=Condylostylus longicornis TaxID=2530218 RepID=UPI00244E178D|nr:protein real-time isoform X2 [Condylostylus longicornis]
MVQKYQSPVRVYKYPFELVMKAYERRFPTCPQMPIVLDCEIVKDEILENGARRNTSRRCKLAVEAPYILRKVIGVDHVFFIQDNYLDMPNRTLNIEATNETFSNRVEIFERCRYYAHPDNPDWTCFDQTATLDIKNFFGFEHSMEKMGMKQYTQTTLKGREIIEYFIEELRNEGITHVERWPISDNEQIDNDNDEKNNETTEITKDIQQIKLSSPEHHHNNHHNSHHHHFASRHYSHESHEILLDGDFIAKFLGHLTPMQESKLLELRKKIEELEFVDKIPSYQTLLRFLRARDFSIEKSFHMLEESLKWRKENNVDSILNEYTIPSVVVNHFPGGWHHRDIDGRPLYILRLGHMDVKGLLKAVGEDGLLKLSIYICEQGIKKINESAKKLNKPILNWSLLVDLDGLSMRHLWRPGVKALYNIIETVEKNYPETMGRVLVVRAPRVFPIAWTIVSAFIHENTRSKFLFYGGPDCLHMKDGLEQYIESDKIPDFLGGPCKSLIHEGGLVPKTLYKMNSEEEAQNGAVAHEHHNLYQSVELKNGQTHEVVIKNSDPKSVLTWDFDILRSDVHFTLYRTSEDLGTKEDSYSSYIELCGFEEGVHYTREEPTTICRHKESVQGSHVMAAKETYVLHWYCTTTSGEEPAQLHFFYEILSSAHYKGSMTSLQSGFSTNSASSSCQSR